MCEVDGYWNVWKYLKIRNIKNLLKFFFIKCDTHQMTSGGDLKHLSDLINNDLWGVAQDFDRFMGSGSRFVIKAKGL